jgi:hypothetical protein
VNASPGLGDISEEIIMNKAGISDTMDGKEDDRLGGSEQR